MSFPNRPSRVADAIQKEISQMILQELKDPRIGFVTVTRIEVTRDLRLARVFYSVMGDPAAQETSQKALETAKGFIRKQLGRRLRLRYTPELQFRLDDSVERSMKITNILDRLKGESKDHAD